MGAYAEGRIAWQCDVAREDCPYRDDLQERQDRRDWLAGWDDEAKDNSQFGVGA